MSTTHEDNIISDSDTDDEIEKVNLTGLQDIILDEIKAKPEIARPEKSVSKKKIFKWEYIKLLAERNNITDPALLADFKKKMNKITVSELKDKYDNNFIEPTSIDTKVDNNKANGCIIKDSKTTDNITPPKRLDTHSPIKIVNLDIFTAKKLYSTNVILAKIIEEIVPTLAGFSETIVANEKIMTDEYLNLIKCEKAKGTNIALDPRYNFIITNTLLAGSVYMKNIKEKKKI